MLIVGAILRVVHRFGFVTFYRVEDAEKVLWMVSRVSGSRVTDVSSLCHKAAVTLELKKRAKQTNSSNRGYMKAKEHTLCLFSSLL